MGLAAIGAAACGSTSTSPSTTGAAVANINPTDLEHLDGLVARRQRQHQRSTAPSTPTGTLTLAGSTDVSGMLDPQGEYDTIGYSCC